MGAQVSILVTLLLLTSGNEVERNRNSCIYGLVRWSRESMRGICQEPYALFSILTRLSSISRQEIRFGLVPHLPGQARP